MTQKIEKDSRVPQLATSHIKSTMLLSITFHDTQLAQKRFTKRGAKFFITLFREEDGEFVEGRENSF